MRQAEMAEQRTGLVTGQATGLVAEQGAVMAMAGSRVVEAAERRDGTTGRIARTVPQIWAVRAADGRVRRFTRCGAGTAPVAGVGAAARSKEVAARPEALRPMLLAAAATPARVPEAGAAATASPIAETGARGVEVAFYRKYTEGMLRRYGVLSMEGGRVPSLLGREMFRGRVTSYRVKSFEDVVIFCHDVESCLKRLSDTEQQLLKRIALQEYTHAEAAGMLGLSLRSCVRQYAEAVDRLTGIFLKERMLEPLQGMD